MKPNNIRTIGAFLTLGLIAAASTASATVLLSVGKTVTVSSEQTTTNPTNTGVKGNDGSLSTRWAANTSTFPEWWKVDLGVNYALSSATINWYNTASRAYKYKIEVSTDDSTYTLVKDNTGNTTFADTTDNFTAVARYIKVTVTGCTTTGNSSFYECSIYENPGVPPAPTGVTATEGDAQVTLNWTASSGATSYNIYRATTSGGAYTTVVTGVTGTSYTNTGLTNGTGYYYLVRPVNATGEGSPCPEVTASPTNVPSPWLTKDIGTVGAVGGASYASGIYTATGAGADIYGTADAFRYIYQTATGDCTVIAKVETLGNTNANAKTGVMIRDSLNPDAINASVVITPSSGIYFQRRTTTGGSTTVTQVTGFAPAYWVKLVRTGNSLTAFRSSDGTTWTAVGTAQTVTMGSTVYIGFPVSSHVSGTLCTATLSNVSPAIVAPTAPSGLGATAVSSSQINLAWTDNSSNETGFRIERKTGSGGTYAEIATVGSNVTSYSDTTGLAASTTYYYQVRAYNTGGNSAYSASANATTLVPVPVAPSDITFTGTTSSAVTVNWVDHSSDETGFKVERKTGVGGTYAQVGTSAANTPTFPDSGLSTFTTYYYRVRANNAGGDSGYATEMPVTTLDVAPAAPSGMTLGTVASNHVDISWTDNSNGATGNETNFLIERKTGSGGSFSQVGIVGANVTTFSDTSVASGITAGYYYRVRATNSGGNSTYSGTSAQAQTPGSVITTPGNPTLTPVDSDKMDITITANANNVVIERSTTGVGGTFTSVGTITAGQTVFHDTGLTAHATYYYRVRATSGTDNSAFTSNVSKATMIPAPTNLALSIVSNAQISLSWTDNSTDESGFSVERKTGTGSYSVQGSTLPPNTTTYLSGANLSTDTLYTYRVRVPLTPFGNPSSDISNYSNEVSVILLPTPTLSATAISSTRIDLTWTDPSTNETGFKIERRADNGAFTQIATCAANVTSYSDTGLSPDTTYVYRVRSYRDAAGIDVGGNSNFSSVVSLSTQLGGGLSSPWVDADIGSPTLVGSAGYSSGTYNIEGSGADISGTSDSFHYVYQPLSGSGSIVARIASLERSHESAKAGVMIRESTSANSAFAMMTLTPGYGHGSSFRYRLSGQSVVAVTPNPEDGIVAPYYVKLVRSGNDFSAYKSSDGTTWVLAGTMNVPMATNVLIGLPVCSHTASLCRVVADNVTVTTGATTLPAAPSGLSVSTASSSQLNLSWTDNSSNETGFRIERKTGLSGSYAPIATVTAGVTTYNDTGLAAGTYYYRVSAYNAGGDSAYAPEYSGTTTGAPSPALLSVSKPVTFSLEENSGSNQNFGVQGNDGDGSTRWSAGVSTYPQWWRVDLGASYALTAVKISWYSSSSRAYKYRIETSADDATYTTAVDKTANTTQGDSVDTFTATGRYVRIWVTGVTPTGGAASFYECQIYKAGFPADASALGFATGTTANQLNLTWTDNSGGTAGFKIERRTGSLSGSSYAQIATVGAGVTSYSDTGLAAGTNYYYRVLATIDGVGDALNYTAAANATTTNTGGFTRKYFSGITGTAISALTSDADYTASPQTPQATNQLNTLEAPYNITDNYGEAITGYVHPPTTGDYTFWIASKDTSELWLSTDSTEANCVRIARVDLEQTQTIGMGPRNWTKHNIQCSDYRDDPYRATPSITPHQITLTAGQNYFIKVLHKDGTNTDHLAVAWAGPGFTRQVLSDTGEPLTSSITSPADGATFTEGSNITINASATAATGKSIVKVEFLLNGDSKVEAKLGEDTTSPYSYTWNSVAAGSYVLTTRAWDTAGVSVSSSVKVTVTNSSFLSGTWAERILNGDGTTNWTEYANVANNYDRRDIVEYRYGPTYKYYYPTPGTFHTLNKQSSEGGVLGHPFINGNTDWYSEGGQLVFSPNASASSAYQSGVGLAINGDIYTYSDSPGYCFINGLQWTGGTLDPGHGQQMPDPSVTQPAFKAACGGTVPPPIATIRTGALGGISGFLIFKNGMITSAGDGQTDSYNYVPSGIPRYAFTQLAAGKVPTAGAATLNNEFLLVTVWDTTNHKGQVAVIAVNGQIRAQQNALANHQLGEFFWGLPSRFTVRSLKVLGYIDLPTSMNAPAAIRTSQDMAQEDGVGADANEGLASQLNSQYYRDQWYNWSGGAGTENASYHKTAKSGYAIVASRAENKVVFIDLQPLFEYYRQMYFTTQANYDLTKNAGPASNQWPFTFAYAPEQTPTVYQTITVTNPSAIMAGLPQNPNGGGGTTNAFLTNAYVATMDGQLQVYNVGDLVTTASGGSIGAPSTVTIGKDPTSIDITMETFSGATAAINCRGDKLVQLINSTGAITYTLSDSRIQDPITTALSHNGRLSFGMDYLHVMDFEGSQVLTYRIGSTSSDTPPVIPPSDESGAAKAFEFTNADPMPGCPIMYTRMGVN